MFVSVSQSIEWYFIYLRSKRKNYVGGEIFCMNFRRVFCPRTSCLGFVSGILTLFLVVVASIMLKSRNLSYVD